MPREIEDETIESSICVEDNTTYQSLMNNFENVEIVYPAFDENWLPIDGAVLSRFIAKIALEALADKMKHISNSLDELIDNEHYDPIRNHVRLGAQKDWTCYSRRIYASDQISQDADGKYSQLIHESDFLFIPVNNTSIYTSDDDYIFGELYFIIAIWGIEITINMGGKSIDGYRKWLEDHDNMSPLYYPKE